MTPRDTIKAVLRKSCPLGKYAKKGVCKYLKSPKGYEGTLEFWGCVSREKRQKWLSC